MFQDQYAEFLELQQQLDSAQKKLQQLKALLTSLPPPRSQVSNRVETPAPQPFQIGWAPPQMSQHQPLRSFLDGSPVSLSLSFLTSPWVQHSLSPSSFFPCRRRLK